MILKSYIVEQNVEILKKYKANLIYGENDGIKNDIKEEIKNKNKDKDCEVTNFFETDILKSNLLYENISNQSLFSEKKIVFIHEASDKIFSQIGECVEKDNNDIQIYIFAGNLEKKSKLRAYFEKDKNLAIFPCYEDNERTLISYINKQLRDYKGLTGEITNLIMNNSNLDRRIIKSEINKIKDFFIEKKINKELIVEILNIKNDSGFNEIRDKALMGKKLEINKLLSTTEILNEEVFFYLNSLNYRVMRLHEITKISDNKMNYEEVLEKIKPPVFWKDKPVLLQQLKRWSQKKLEKVLIKIGKTEILMKKNSSLKNDVIIKNLIIELTNNATIS
jgi:DNA polymerase III subunit delta